MPLNRPVRETIGGLAISFALLWLLGTIEQISSARASEWRRSLGQGGERAARLTGSVSLNRRVFRRYRSEAEIKLTRYQIAT
jgi:hypothetical protein